MTEMCRDALIALAAACLSVTPNANAADQAPPPIREFDIQTIERLGREMYAQDQLAWVATDVLFAKISESDAQREGVRGWITDTIDGKDIVRFIRRTDQGAEVAYDVTFGPGVSPVLSIPVDRRMTQAEQAQDNARRLAIDNIGLRCSNRYNTIALKDPESDGWLVWALAATTDDDQVLLGGHHRFTISADGTSIRAKDALSQTCRQYSKKSVSIFQNHVISRTPIETYVFANLTYKVTLHIGTDDGTAWKIDMGRVGTIEQDSPGLDGTAARALAGFGEYCTILFSKRGENPKRFYPGDASMRISVINAAENDAKFSFKKLDGSALRMPRDMIPESVMCERADIVPSPNDYKVLAAGYVLYIKDTGTGHPERFGKLEMANGQFQFNIIGGEALTMELQERMIKRLNVLQNAFAAAK